MRYLVICSILLIINIAGAQSNPSDTPLPKFSMCKAAQDAGVYLTKDNWLIERGELTWVEPIFRSAVSHIIDLQNTFKNQGIYLIPVIIPFRPMVHSPNPNEVISELKDYDYYSSREIYHQMIKQLNDNNAIAPDLLFYMQDKDINHNQFFYGDHHITPNGAASIASAVYEQIKYINIFREITDQPGQLKYGPIIKHPDPSRTKILKEKCGAQPDELIHTVDFVADRQLNLLTDDPNPQIVYVGTSMGRSDFGLISNLKYYLRKDILDFHMESGGLYAPLMEYLSKKTKGDLPKFIIWEWPLEEIVYTRSGVPKFSDYYTFNIIKGETIGCQNLIYSTNKTKDKIITHLPKNVILQVSSDTPMSTIIVSLIGKKTSTYKMDIPARVTNKLESFYYTELDEQPQNISLDVLGAKNVKLNICSISNKIKK